MVALGIMSNSEYRIRLGSYCFGAHLSYWSVSVFELNILLLGHWYYWIKYKCEDYVLSYHLYTNVIHIKKDARVNKGANGVRDGMEEI